MPKRHTGRCHSKSKCQCPPYRCFRPNNAPVRRPTCADLSVTISVTEVGDLIRFTFRVINGGPLPAVNSLLLAISLFSIPVNLSPGDWDTTVPNAPVLSMGTLTPGFDSGTSIFIELQHEDSIVFGLVTSNTVECNLDNNENVAFFFPDVEPQARISIPSISDLTLPDSLPIPLRTRIEATLANLADKLRSRV